MIVLENFNELSNDLKNEVVNAVKSFSLANEEKILEIISSKSFLGIVEENELISSISYSISNKEKNCFLEFMWTKPNKSYSFFKKTKLTPILFLLKKIHSKGITHFSGIFSKQALTLFKKLKKQKLVKEEKQKFETNAKRYKINKKKFKKIEEHLK